MSKILKCDKEYLKSLVSILLKEAKKHSADGKVDYNEETIGSLNNICNPLPVWTIAAKEVEKESLDRLGNMYGGFPFTSAKHPWPLDAKGNPLCPFIQINLDSLYESTKQYVGSGLLQLWIDITDVSLPGEIRRISKSECQQPMSADFLNYMKMNKHGIWENISCEFSLFYSGDMCRNWEFGMYGWSVDRYDLSEQEMLIIEEIQQHVSDNNFYELSGTDWIFGYPDQGSGTPADRYSELPQNFFQFSSQETFPMALAAKYANIFSRKKDNEVEFFYEY
jgi:hypothetical protein